MLSMPSGLINMALMVSTGEWPAQEENSILSYDERKEYRWLVRLHIFIYSNTLGLALHSDGVNFA